MGVTIFRPGARLVIPGVQVMQTSASAAQLPLDLGITFTGAWSLYPLSAAATNLFTLRRISDSAEQTIARIGNAPDTATATTFIGASSGRVKTLIDQSGGGNNATQATANSQMEYVTHFGKVAAFGTGTSNNNAYFDLPSAPSLTGRNFSVYAVYSAQDLTSSNVASIPIGVLNWGATSAGGYQTSESRTAAHRSNLGWSTNPHGSVAMPAANCSINISVIRSNATNTRFVSNAHEFNSTTLTDTSTKALIYIGRQPTVGYSKANRLMAFLVGPAHTLAEEQAVVASLQSLFGTSAKTKLVAFDGDSITAGHNEATSLDERDLSWPYQMMMTIADGAVVAHNRAISSSVIVDTAGTPNKDLTDWAPEKLDAVLNAAYTKKILVVMAGRNDIAVINAAGAGLTTYNRLVTYCQARKAAGWLKIIIVNAIPAKDLVTAGIDAERTDYNSRITANALTDWDAVVDAAALNWQPGGCSDWSTNYQGTVGIHPNAAGRTLLANAVQPALAALL